LHTDCGVSFQPTLPPVKWERIMRLAMQPVPQVKRWQLHTFLLMLSALLFTLLKLSLPPILQMSKLL